MRCFLMPFAVCRVPAFSSDVEMEEVWDELKSLISESSSNFFQLIRDCKVSDIDLLDEHIKYTLFKYFNRAKFRATPFGSFASISIIPVNNAPKNEIIIGAPVKYSFANWPEKSQINTDPKWILKTASFFETNSTIYFSGQQLKFLYFNSSNFELSSVDSNEMIAATLNFCRQKRTKKELFEYLKFDRFLSPIQITYLLRQLVDLQLLLTNLHPNIVGTDFFTRSRINAEGESRYIITSRPLLTGQLSIVHFKELSEAIQLLNKYLPLPMPEDLSAFKRKFLERFGQSEVPLYFALDPQTGLGCGDLEQDIYETDVLKFLKAEKYKSDASTTVLFSKFHQFLLRSIANRETVNLESLSISEILLEEPRLPNTFSAIVNLADDLIVVNAIGGCTANSLLGRFTIAGTQFKNAGISVSKIEMEANPEIVFFDIAYQADEKVDNVNRRELVYPYVLPILSYTTGDSKIELDDIYISLKGEELILRSKSLKRRIIPRMASAYNYIRSDLSLFRFLSDIQNQGIRPTLTLDIEKMFPKLERYPRVQYKNVVISTAKWLVPDHFCNPKLIHSENLLTELQIWLRSLPINRFKCGKHDLKMQFEVTNKTHLMMFLKLCKNNSELYIEEALTGHELLVTDGQKKKYHSELVLNFFHKDQIYLPVTNDIDEYKKIDPHPLGAEWVYFEIYCHYSQGNPILSSYLNEFLKSNKKLITSFFFIRYSDPKFHIRLRIKLKNVNDGYIIISTFYSKIKKLVLEGKIHNFFLKPYLQETERYGLKNMSTVEHFFFDNSKLILEILKKKFDDNILYLFSINLLEYILINEGFNYEEGLNFYAKITKSLADEFKTTPEGFKKINRQYKIFKTMTNNIDCSTLINNNSLLKNQKSFIKAIRSCTLKMKNKLIADLFHMHVNRLFTNEQRVHEMMIYHFLLFRLRSNFFTNR